MLFFYDEDWMRWFDFYYNGPTGQSDSSGGGRGDSRASHHMWRPSLCKGHTWKHADGGDDNPMKTKIIQMLNNVGIIEGKSQILSLRLTKI